MSGVELIEVEADEAELRLDRWFRRHYPGLTHGRLEKLLRTGQIRIDGRRAKAGLRLKPGQRVRVPPGEGEVGQARGRAARPVVSDAGADEIRSLVLYRSERLIAINKPPGLAVQGGSGISRHLDAMLDGLRFGAAERPRLVHRLDRDTSGVLLLARDARAAAELGAAFRNRRIRKLYWALVVGVPKPKDGDIGLALKKAGPAGRERMKTDDRAGKPALTRYRTVETLGRRAAWLVLEPLTGRTHQLRAHCAAIGTPIVGDGKYGGGAAHRAEIDPTGRLHLHARALVVPGGLVETPTALRLEAPLAPHMADTWARLGLDVDLGSDLPEGHGQP